MNIQSDPALIDEVADFLETNALRAGLDESAAGDLVIAGTEAVNNAIHHGNHDNLEERVHLTLHDNDPEFLVLEVVDHGGSFSPDHLPDPREADHLLDDHGRGWLIIQHLMDEVQVVSDEVGTRLIMKKRRPTH